MVAPRSRACCNRQQSCDPLRTNGATKRARLWQTAALAKRAYRLKLGFGKRSQAATHHPIEK